MGSKPAWSTKLVPGQLGPQSETLSHTHKHLGKRPGGECLPSTHGVLGSGFNALSEKTKVKKSIRQCGLEN